MVFFSIIYSHHHDLSNFNTFFLESFKKELLLNRDFLMLINNTQVHLDKYPSPVIHGSVKSLKYLLNSPDLYDKLKDQDLYGLQGSFRKLEID